jgi:hypothetical protein
MNNSIKSWIAIFLGIIIVVVDVAWLVVGSSYTYTPWLALGIVIFVASVAWLVIDISMMEGGKKTMKSGAAQGSSKTSMSK